MVALNLNFHLNQFYHYLGIPNELEEANENEDELTADAAQKIILEELHAVSVDERRDFATQSAKEETSKIVEKVYSLTNHIPIIFRPLTIVISLVVHFFALVIVSGAGFYDSTGIPKFHKLRQLREIQLHGDLPLDNAKLLEILTKVDKISLNKLISKMNFEQLGIARQALGSEKLHRLLQKRIETDSRRINFLQLIGPDKLAHRQWRLILSLTNGAPENQIERRASIIDKFKSAQFEEYSKLNPNFRDKALEELQPENMKSELLKLEEKPNDILQFKIKQGEKEETVAISKNFLQNFKSLFRHQIEELDPEKPIIVENIDVVKAAVELFSKAKPIKLKLKQGGKEETITVSLNILRNNSEFFKVLLEEVHLPKDKKDLEVLELTVKDIEAFKAMITYLSSNNPGNITDEMLARILIVAFKHMESFADKLQNVFSTDELRKLAEKHPELDVYIKLRQGEGLKPSANALEKLSKLESEAADCLTKVRNKKKHNWVPVVTIPLDN